MSLRHQYSVTQQISNGIFASVPIAPGKAKYTVETNRKYPCKNDTKNMLDTFVRNEHLWNSEFGKSISLRQIKLHSYYLKVKLNYKKLSVKLISKWFTDGSHSHSVL